MKSEDLYRTATGRVMFARTGFSWPAFLFGPMWAIAKRDWSLFFMLAIPFSILIIVDEILVKPSKNILALLAMMAAYLGYMVVCGVYGNRWRVASLIRHGYKKADDTKA